ncbi:hypothetical protein BDF20DRAFT_896449 [Mycotypha africana]|uniref:uncharacterized protein n=1 Tax=Mycotypha africana TaxID=64632 RepID=UPI002301EC4B|nr:uncharacterized protein BDF20DRAFT_896449 [Mycotypha africana]KAI8968452.1 hypothetical protein BDF20DRAFT_896449 [Mycotypha africana]
MSSRLAKQSLDLLAGTGSFKKLASANNSTATSSIEKKDRKDKLKLPKTNRGIKKIKYEMRYGRHKKAKELQQEKQKRENPIDKLHEEALTAEEQLKWNVQLMKHALRSTDLERKIHKKVMKQLDTKRTKKWSNKVSDSENDTDSD